MRNFQFFSLLQSKSVNNVCKLLQLLGDFVPRLPTGASPGPHCGTKDPVGYSPPQMKFPGAAIVWSANPSLYLVFLGDDIDVLI